MKRTLSLFLVLCMVVPALLVPSLTVSAITLPYESKMSANMPTDTFAANGSLDVTFKGGWDAVTYPAKNYTADARLILDSLINIVQVNGINSASDSFWGVKGSTLGQYTAVRARGGNAYWGGASSLNTPATYIGGWRYTAEYSGTVNLSFGAIRQIDAATNVYVAAFIDGKMVWPTVDGTVYREGAENPYADWQVIGSATNVASTFNADKKLADLYVSAGDAVEFLIAGNGTHNQNKAVVQPIVTYITEGVIEPEEPTDPTPGVTPPAVDLPYANKMSANMPTDTFAANGSLDVTFKGGWDAVTYPAKNYTADARLILDSLINIVQVNGINSASDSFWGVKGSTPGQYTAVRARGGNAFWGGASSLNTPATYIGGWRYTAEYSGIVDLSFGAIRQIDAATKVYVAAFIDGKMVWPTVDGAVYREGAENPYADWQVIGSATNVASTFNADKKLADLYVSAGDAVEFLIAGNGTHNQNKAVVQPIVTYTDFVTLPRAGSAAVILGEAFGVNFSIDATTVPVGAENIGALVNGVYVEAKDGYVRADGIAAKNLADKITFVPTYTYKGAILYGEETSVSLADVLMQYVTDANASAEVKNLAIATLNYGAAAQIYFNYGLDRLANAALTAEQKTVTYTGHYESVAAIRGDAAKNVATPYSATLLLDDTVNFKFVYTSTEENFQTDYKFALLDEEGRVIKTVAPVLCEGQSRAYKAIFAGVMPTGWNTAYTVAVVAADSGEVVGQTLTYSVMSYHVRVEGELEAVSSTVTPAMYALYEAVVAYAKTLA